MHGGETLNLVNEALWLVLILSAPAVIVVSIVGMFVAIIQAATQVQEQTFQYLVKFLAVVLTIFLTSSFLGASLYRFSDRIFSDFPALVR